jgi:hypothetical protein
LLVFCNSRLTATPVDAVHQIAPCNLTIFQYRRQGGATRAIAGGDAEDDAYSAIDKVPADQAFGDTAWAFFSMTTGPVDRKSMRRFARVNDINPPILPVSQLFVPQPFAKLVVLAICRRARPEQDHRGRWKQKQRGDVDVRKGILSLSDDKAFSPWMPRASCGKTHSVKDRSGRLGNLQHVFSTDAINTMDRWRSTGCSVRPISRAPVKRPEAPAKLA